ncbi:MAG: bifunctional (p)ppGpp synthetase/guanosine-3',5'-bis(diphosphate) 3'-pyrophosphohydrolase [Ruminococcaceae bacterium]|nr:bifunctional (p)ppGpp synthetase/guanosine-3',5'-bis(diphosphate) 3'-pyrophosphohydrolase [Oscillospiraceae bacterium]
MTEPFEESVESRYRDLAHRIELSSLSVDLGRIRAAFELSAGAHRDQKRKDGSPYVTHTIAAAEIIVDMGLDEDSIVAALLHDTIEDTSVTYEDILKQFGPSVANIVEGVTKLTRVNYTSREDEQMENMRKMLMAMSKDIRVILIKLADRLHNMRTMDYQSPEKQRLKSLETMQIYAPIAHRLGMQAVKWELEDLSLMYLDPIGYHSITTAIEDRRAEFETFMTDMEAKIRKRLEEWNVNCTIYHRIKHLYSIYRKMYTQKLELREIFDVCALRVIVDNVSDCYNVLGQIHDMYKPVPGKFKDYISTPKPNGYQSVHTTVIGSEAIPFEVQIRTWDMHRVAEYGVAAHWKYKSGDSGLRGGEEEKFAWVRRLLESQQDSDAEDFFSELRVDMFADEVFVFTPKGDVSSLPAGATPIDFAYSVHSAVGNSMVGAKVNGRIVPFDHQLQNGDIVEILTSKSCAGPSRDWLKIARSGSARTKIKQWFKKERREENVVQGKEMLDAELRRAGITLAELQEADVIAPFLKKHTMTGIDDLYAAIGYGGITATKTANRLRDELVRLQKANGSSGKTAIEKMNEAVERRNSKEAQEKPQHAIQGVLIEGLDNCLVKFSRCCTPVPGDEIVGFITRGYGVSVHRTDCRNHISSRLNPDDGGRWIEASWASETTGTYVTTLRIASRERSGLVMDIALALNSLNAKVRSLSARDVGDGLASTTLTVEVRNLSELRQITAKLSAIAGVSSVTRTNC